MSERQTPDTRTPHRRHRVNYRPWLKLILRLLIIGLVSLLIFLLINNWRKIAPLSFLDWYDQVSGNVEKGQGYPYTLDGNAVVDMAEVSSHLVVLNKSSVCFFTDDAACVAERTHSLADPTLHTAGSYALITEVGGERFRLETRRETVLTSEFTNRKIYAGSLIADGTMAFVLNSASQSFLSEIRVVNAEGEELLQYQSSKYLFSDVALSPDGKQVTVTGTSAEGGTLKSVVLIVTLKDKSVREFSGTEVLLHSLAYLSDSTILAIGDREVWTLTGDEEKLSKIRCDGVVPVGYTATSSMACVTLRRDDATDAGTAWLFDHAGNLVEQVEYTGEVRCVSGRGDEVVLLTDSTLYELTTAGIQKEYSIPSDAVQSVLYGDDPLILTFSCLKRLEN